MIDFIHDHGAINNKFLTRFKNGLITDKEFKIFCTEFFHFSREWPAILATLLVNTADEDEAKELTKILVSELGDGNPNNRHELLFRDFLRSINIDPKKAMKSNPLPTTKNFIDGMKRLFSNKDHFIALGAEFGLENMAIIMWDHLIPGLNIWKKNSIPEMDIKFFTFHRELEEQHEESIGNALNIHDDNINIQKSFHKGCKEVLDLLESFWIGIERSK